MQLAKNWMKRYKIWIICLLVFLLMPFVKPAFISANNIESIFSSMMAYGVTALGLTASLIAGEINISIGSVLAFSGVVFARYIPLIGMVPALLTALLLSLLLGLANGYLVAYQKLPAFLTAVVFQISVRGLALLVSNSTPIQIKNDALLAIANCRVGPIPICFVVFLLLVLAMEVFLKYTQVGRNMFATGGNAEAAEAAGLQIVRYKCLGLMLSDFMAGLGGIFLTTRFCSATPSVGEDAVMTVMPIIVIGGTSLSGGKGSAVGTLSGALLMYLIFNVMSLFNVYVNVQSIIKGMIVLAIVVADKYIANKNKKV